MGNAPDRTIDKFLMESSLSLHSQFIKQEPLFHVEDIKFPLSTQGMKIVDATGRRVKLAGGNWSGGHMCRHCVDGLQCRSLRELAQHIRYEFKMNCIRLTFSLQLFYDNNIIPTKYLLANPDLQGKTSMQIFDITVKTLTDVGLMVILNCHTSTSQWCCSNDDGDGLWWSREYPEYKFFQCTQQLAKRYANNERVIGNDLRNELRKAHGSNPTWGDGNPLTDWKRAAKISAELTLKHAPHWLIFVAGLNYQLDLSFIKESPLELSVPNKLCYTGHFYGFSWPIPSWTVYTYENFKKKLFNTQTYVRALGYPFLLGQFGNNQQDIPWKYLMEYIRQTDIDWTYWALDGFKCQRQKDETYGVFTNDHDKARHPEMLQDMIKVGCPAGALLRYPQIRAKNLSNKQTTQSQQSKPNLTNYQGQNKNNPISNQQSQAHYQSYQQSNNSSGNQANKQQNYQKGAGQLQQRSQQIGLKKLNYQSGYQQPQPANYQSGYQQPPSGKSGYQQPQPANYQSGYQQPQSGYQQLQSAKSGYQQPQSGYQQQQSGNYQSGYQQPQSGNQSNESKTKQPQDKKVLSALEQIQRMYGA